MSWFGFAVGIGLCLLILWLDVAFRADRLRRYQDDERDWDK
jgi:hypothetical protein